MATLHLKTVPDDLYEALRKLAEQKHTSIATEVLLLLHENVLTENELNRRCKLFADLKKIRATYRPGKGPFQVRKTSFERIANVNHSQCVNPNNSPTSASSQDAASHGSLLL